MELRETILQGTLKAFSKKGLKFTELTLNALSENNINIEICPTVRLDGSINDYPNLKQKLIDDVKFIFENYEY